MRILRRIEALLNSNQKGRLHCFFHKAAQIKTVGGKIICLAVSIYSAGMFGYLTALFAALIIDRDIKVPKVEVSNQKQLQDIQEEIIKLRKLIEETAKSSQRKST